MSLFACNGSDRCCILHVQSDLLGLPIVAGLRRLAQVVMHLPQEYSVSMPVQSLSVMTGSINQLDQAAMMLL